MMQPLMSQLFFALVTIAIFLACVYFFIFLLGLYGVAHDYDATFPLVAPFPSHGTTTKDRDGKPTLAKPCVKPLRHNQRHGHYAPTTPVAKPGESPPILITATGPKPL